MAWTVVATHDECGPDAPWAVIDDTDGTVAGCYTDEAAAVEAVAVLEAEAAAAPEAEPADMPPPDMPMPDMAAAGHVAWEGVLAVEGTPTGDGRQFTPGALTWADLPAPLRWQTTDTHGGTLVNGTVQVGRIDTIARVGAQIVGTGVIDLGCPDGAEAARRMGTATVPGFLSGISIDADDPENGLVDYVMPAGCDGMDPESADLAEFERCAMPELTVYHSGRIRAATLVDIPAFVESRIFLTEDAAATVAAASGEPCPCTAPADLVAAAHTITLTVPDASAFGEPAGPPDIGAITLTDDGRLFGYLAPARVAHRGYADRPVYVPTGNVDYTRWMNRATICAGGERIATGAVTMGCGHAPTHRGVTAGAALEHYDNSCAIIATARVGENRHGAVWIAGALLPDVTPDQVARLLACQLSGDWRPNRDRPGTRELVGVLAVPVPGFPVAHAGMRVTTDAGQLVASAVPIRHGPAPALVASGAPNPGILAAARILAAATGRDRRSRLSSMAARVRGG